MPFSSRVSAFIQRIKGDSSYEVDSALTASQLTLIIWYRFRQVVRGYYLKLFIKSSGLVFAGKGVKIEYKNQFISGKNLIIDDRVMISALSKNRVVLGENVTIGKNSLITCTGVIKNLGIGLEIGNDSAIGAYNFISCQGGVEIGEKVIMGPYVKIFSENHNFGDLDVPIKDQGESRKGVVIEDNCWIGAGAIVLDGVRIGKGSVIAAGAVVTKSVEPNSVIGGNPGKVLKKRN